MLPWRRRAVEAEQELVEAEDRRRNVDALVQHSRRVTNRMRQEIDKNGFTDMLIAAMQRGT